MSEAVPFDPGLVLDRVAAVLAGLPGLSADLVQIGVPTGAGARLTAWTALASVAVEDLRNGRATATLRIRVVLVHQVNEETPPDQLATVEKTLAALGLGFLKAFYQGQRNLGGAWKGGRVDNAIQADPRYDLLAGHEYRAMAFDLLGVQEEPFDPAQQP